MDLALRTASAAPLTQGLWNVSVANWIVIITMLVVFALALVIPFPKERSDSRRRS